MTKRTIGALKVLALAAAAAAGLWWLLRKKPPAAPAAEKEPTVVVSTDDPNMIVGGLDLSTEGTGVIEAVDYVPTTAEWKT